LFTLSFHLHSVEFIAVFYFVFLLLRAQLLEPGVEVSHDELRVDLRGRLQLSVDSVLVDFSHWIDILGFLDMQSHHFDGVHLLVHVVDSSVNFPEPPLPYQINVFELLLEPSGVQYVL